MSNLSFSLKSWVLYDKGKTGTRAQCEGLASLLGLSPQYIEISTSWLWRLLPPRLRLFPLKTTHPRLEAPWPDLIIGAGRATVAPCMALKRQLGNAVKVIQLMDPCVDPSFFDLVIAPHHDQLTGPNVIQTLGTLHALKREVLEVEKEILRPHIAHLPPPYSVLLLGGPTRRYDFNIQILQNMMQALRHLVSQTKGSLLIAPSRRTPPVLIDVLLRLVQEIPHFISGAYYKGFLAVAEQILVTCDSISMLSEACFTGKPVYIYPLPGKAGKFELFYQKLIERNHARLFSGSFSPFSPVVLDQSDCLKEQIESYFKGDLSH